MIQRTVSPFDLLRRLSSGVRPGAARRRAGALPQELQGFDELLAGVHRGATSSDRTVDQSPDLDLELTEDQLERLGVAVDVAEASGAQSLLALVDGHALGVDVADRQITEAGDQLTGRLLRSFDAALLVPEIGARELREHLADPDGPARRAANASSVLSGLVRNASVANLVAAAQMGSASSAVRE